MSLTKDAANTQATTNEAAEQAAIDTAFIVQADLVIASQIVLGQFTATLTLNKGVSALNIINYYQALGYKVLAPYPNGFGYPYANNFGFSDTFGFDDENSDQPVDFFGVEYDFFFNSQTPNLMIADGKTPSVVYLNFA